MSQFHTSFISAASALANAVDNPTRETFFQAWHEAEHALYNAYSAAERDAAVMLRCSIINAARLSDVQFLPYKVTHIDVDTDAHITEGFASWQEADDAVKRYGRNAIHAWHYGDYSFEFATANVEHLHTLHAPIKMDRAVVKIAYGYNSGGVENNVYFVTADGGVLGIDTVIAEIGKVDFTDKNYTQWYIIGFDVNYDDESLVDDHTGKRIPTVYAD